nr:putative transposase [Ipomoea batatas]
MSMLSYGNSVDNNSKTPVIVSTIIDLYGRAEEGHYFVPAKIVGLESGRHWYYTSCSAKGCFKKLDPNQGSLKCDKCFVSCPEITLRYRLIVRVVDKTSDAPLLLWDKECTELIGMSAFDLKSKYSQDDYEIPTELESLRNKAMVFKVSIKDEHLKNPAKPIPVLKITNDQELVSVYCPSLTDDHDELSKMIGEELQDEESDDSESGDEASSPAVQQSLKAIREDSSEKVEPGATKRCLLDQFSSSQDVKRSKAFIIKQEKN